jgi:hypothetical protein
MTVRLRVLLVLLGLAVADATGTRPLVLSFESHGIRLLQLEDPDGNTVQLFSPLEG